jgi:hypothetical protein
MDSNETFFSRIKPNKNELNGKTIFSLIVLFVGIIVVMIVMPYFVSGNFVDSHVNSSSLQEKQLAPEDLYVKRAFEYVDEKATEEKRTAALQNVYPIFTYDISTTYEIINRVLTFNKNIDENYSQGLSDLLISLNPSEKNLFNKTYLNLTDNQKQLLSTWVFEICKDVVQNGYFDASELDLVKNENFSKISIKGLLNDSFNLEKIEDSRVYSVDSLNQKSNINLLIDSYIEKGSIYSTLPVNIVYLSVIGLLEPNVHYDLILTQNEKENTINSIEDVVVFVPSGTKVLSKDTIISEKDLELLYQVEEHSAMFSNIQIITRIFLIIAITLFSLYWFWSKTSYTFRRVQFTLVYLSSMFISLLVSLFITYHFSKNNLTVLSPLLPVLFGTFFVRNITSKRKFGLLFTIQYALYSVLFPGSTFFSFFYLSAIGISFIYIIVYNTDRIARMASIVKGCLVAIMMTLILYAIQGYPFTDLYLSISFILINILLCFLLERMFLPLVDNSLNIPTIFRLEELKNTDQKLLKRLKMTAKGTYNHSLNLADLAYEAAKSIGANAELCRVAALYHDVGKMEHPEYFTENQEDGVNKHDELTPSMSGSIIRSHVKLGVDLCKEMGLPQEIIDIISEHHGSDLIQYFYNEAKKDNENPDYRVETSDYSYNGNPPRSKESAIIMIADSVEAASRSQNTSPQKVGRLIAYIVRQKFDRGQLNDSHLDLTELKTIEKSLEQSLVGKLHTRIKYQDEIESSNIRE